MKINVRLLTILLCAGIGILGGLFILHRIQINRHDSGYLERARAGIQSKNSDEIKSAFRHYGIYLSRNDDPKVRAEYGIALKEHGLAKKAVEQLEKAVRDTQDNEEALKALADIMMYGAGRFADARRHLETLTALAPDNLEYRQQLARCLILENNFAKAEIILQDIVKEDQTQLVCYKILSELYELKLNRPDDAEKLMNEMVTKNPESAEAHRLRAIYLFTHEQEEQAEKDLEKALELAPKDKAVLLLASNIAKSKGNLDQAKKFSLQLIEAEPQAQDGYLQMATLEMANVKLEKALEWIEKGINATRGGSQLLLFHRVDRLLDLHRLKEAKQELKRLSQLSFNPVLISYLEARTNYAEEHWAKAKDQFETVRPNLQRIKSLRFLAPRADLFTAECYRQLGNPDKGKELTSRAQQSNTPILNKDPLQEGRILAQEGKLREAISYFKQLAKHESIALNAQIELFPLLIRRTLSQKESERDWSGVDSALEKINELLPDDPRTALFAVQAIIAKDKENTQEAEAILDKAVQRAKTRAKQWDKLIAELKKAPNAKDATEFLTKASETWAKNNQPIKQSIELLEKGNRDGALKAIETGKKAQVDTKRLWLTRIAIAKSRKDWDRAEAIAQEAIDTLGDSAALRKPLATIIAQRGGDDAPARLETVLKDIDKLPENEQQELWEFVAVLFNRLGQKDRAIELCETAAEKNPNDLFIRRTLFVLALEANKEEIIDKALQQIGKIDQEGPTWHYLTALRISYPLLNKKVLSDEERDDLNAAIDHLNVVEVERPNWGKASLLLGKLYDKTGNTKAALTNLAEAVEFGERDSAGLARLAELYIRENRALEAQTTLNLMRYSSSGLNPAGLIAMAKLKLQQGDQRGAMAELMAAVELLRKQVADSEDAANFLELAQVLSNAAALSRQIGESKLADSLIQEARDMITKASQVDPSDYRPWLILAKLYHDQGKKREVDEVITQIKANVPEEMLQISLARCYESLNRTVEAELACEKALEVANKENDIAKQVAAFYLRSNRDRKKENRNAESILRKMIQGKLPAKEKDLIWARRRLALLLFSRGLQKNRKEAMQLIEENLEADPESLLDQRVQARGLAIKGTRKDKRRAIQILEKLIQRPSPSSDDRFQLAKLYWASDDWNKTSQQMQILLGAATPNPDWYVFYIRCLIDRNELSSAQISWDKLRSMRPNSFTTAELASFIHAGMNQPNRAIADLEDFIKNPKSIPDNELVRLTLVAKTAEGLINHIRNQKSETSQKAQEQYLAFAEKCYRTLAEKHSKNEMALASFLGRHNKRDEAINLAEKAWKTNKPQAIAAATVRLLNTGDATPEQIERVEKILNDATEHFGDRIALDLARAELRTIQKRYDEAEALYREVLKADKENVVAMNNLAVFLALRKMKLDEALKSMNKAIELAGPQATLLDSRASVYLARGELQKALDDIDAALQERHSAVRLFHQAQIQMAAGDSNGAKQSLNKAIKLGLQAGQLQPLERPSYQALRDSLR